MLDGLLGRGGVSSKCKSLIKLTRTRIDVILRKRNAMLNYLKKDIADLLAKGLDSNAFGRAEGVIAELCLTSCYDFIDHVCEFISKHLSTMQKIRDCPEDCKEAVASLMFSAARFSDLPELRDLRDIFQERYGNSLEYYVNQKLVEHIGPKPPDMDRKLKLLEDIASEFSVTWDRSTFERRTNNAAAREDIQKTHVYLHATENKYLAPQVSEAVQTINNDDMAAKKRIEVAHQMKVGDILDDEHHKLFNEQEPVYNRLKSPAGPRTVQKSKDPNVLPRRREFMIDGCSYLAQENVNPGRIEVVSASSTGRADNSHNKHKVDNGGHKAVPEIERHWAAYQVKAEPLPAKGECHVESAAHIKHSQDSIASPMRKLPGEETDRLNPNFRSNIPPPYVKPKKSKHKSRHSESLANGAQNVAPVNDDIPHFTVEYYKDDTLGIDPTPRRRSRRRHPKPSSTPSDSDNVEEVRVVRRVSTSRRRNESKEGLQILFDDDPPPPHRHHGKRDEEERRIDKLLLHYSKKPASGAEPSEKPRRRTKTGSLLEEAEMKDLAQPPSFRSVSLPHEQSSSEVKKVFTRAASFDQEASTPAKHVHPKLPDYDDLAARFAALRRNKD